MARAGERIEWSQAFGTKYTGGTATARIGDAVTDGIEVTPGA